MDNDLHDIDKLFRDSLEPQEQPPSEKVWAKIDKELDKEDSKKPLVGYWLKTGTIIATLLLAFVGYLFYNHQQTNKKENNKIADNKNLNNISSAKDSAKVKSTENNEISTSNKKILINKDSGSNKNNVVILKQDKYNTTNQLDGQGKSTYIKNAQDSMPANTLANFNSKSTKSYPQLKATHNSISKNKTTNNLQPEGTNQLKVVLNTKRFVKNKRNNFIEKNKTDINVGNNITNRELNKEDDPAFENSRLLLANNLIIENNYTLKQPLLIPNSLKAKTSTELQLLNSSQANSGAKITTLKAKKQSSRVYVSFFAAPEWNGYQLQDDDDHGNRGSGRRDDDDKKSIEDREDEDPSFTIGLNIGYQLNKKFALETGLHIGSYKISTDSVKIYAENNAGSVAFKLNTSSGYSYLNGTSATTAGDSTTAQHIKQCVNYIGIPLLLRYKLGNGKLSFNPAVGVMFNFITSTKVNADLDGAAGITPASSKLLGLKKMSVALIFNPSIYYQISNHISLGLEPYFNYNISPITKANVVDSYPYSLGLGAGIKYHF